MPGTELVHAALECAGPLEAHLAKEDGILCGMADRMLPDAEQRRLESAYKTAILKGATADTGSEYERLARELCKRWHIDPDEIRSRPLGGSRGASGPVSHSIDRGRAGERARLVTPDTRAPAGNKMIIEYDVPSKSYLNTGSVLKLSAQGSEWTVPIEGDFGKQCVTFTGTEFLVTQLHTMSP